MLDPNTYEYEAHLVYSSANNIESIRQCKGNNKSHTINDKTRVLS